jgi:aminoglycoside phosphotransferase (APT) family kinase protein
MQASDVARGVASARSIALSLGLRVDHAAVLHNSNKLAVRLAPCEVLARVAPWAHQDLLFEVELARRLAASASPVAALAPGVEPRVYTHDAFAVTLWTYYAPATPADASPDDYARALQRLHAGMRKLDVTCPHFSDRVAEALQLVSSRDLTPALAGPDRELLIDALRERRRAIGERAAPEQLLHGEPHPGNVLATPGGPLFIDFETCCRGPVEFDLAHAPKTVSDGYPKIDEDLLDDCRGLVLAMVAAWRWDAADQFPDGQKEGRHLLRALRLGPPWPSLDAVTRTSRGA